jgi:hypothetical protein
MATRTCATPSNPVNMCNRCFTISVSSGPNFVTLQTLLFYTTSILRRPILKTTLVNRSFKIPFKL